jgi:GNAT superfamily N-acetyltransferase
LIHAIKEVAAGTIAELADQPVRGTSGAATPLASKAEGLEVDPVFPPASFWPIGLCYSGLRGLRFRGHSRTLAQATACNPAVVTVRIDGSIEGINWAQAKADLAADDFDNGRTPEALGRSFSQSPHVAFARDGDRVVGMARLLSDGVCNAYLLDVWTASGYRRQGIASTMIRQLLERVPGQHVGLQTDEAQAVYESLGFREQPEFWSIVVGSWLDNDANR